MKIKTAFLLIEDNVVDQIVTRELLRKQMGDIQVHIAKNGKEALTWLAEREETSPLVVLLDIRMPEMNGFEFLEQYKDLPKSVHDSTDIYMLSSTLDSNDIQCAEESKFVKKLLGKPLSFNDFEKLINKENI